MTHLILDTLFVAVISVASGDLRFENPSVELGNLRAGERLTHRIWFTNTSSQVVQVVDVRGSCGCLHPSVSEKMVKPGQKAYVQMIINPFGQPAGKQRWRAFVRYRLGDRIHQQTLEVTANLITEVTIQPSRLTLYPLRTIRHSLTFVDLRETPLQITGVRLNCSWLGVGDVSPFTRDSDKWTAYIHLHSTKTIPPGKHHLDLAITTNDPAYKELHVPINVVKREESLLQAIPEQVVIQTEHGRPFPSQLVRIRRRDNKMVKIDKISCDHPAVTTRWAAGPGRFVTVRVMIDHSQISEKKMKCQLNIRTADPVDQTLNLTVTCVSE